MCGIVGYIARKQNPNSLKLGMEALKKLEYRGYDSAGFAFWDGNKNDIFCQKAAGRIAALEEKANVAVNAASLSASPLILHTRWATHGGVCEENAHPHFDCKNNIYLVHNGIIENYKELKESLQKEGHQFHSETDTEVLAHLVEKFFTGNLEDAVRKVLPLIKGTYGIAAIAKNDPNKLVAAKLSSPLLLGLSENEYIIASDPSAVVTHTNKVIYLDDNEIVTITPDNFFIIKEKQPEELDLKAEDSQKGGYPHFMLKEIMEEPEAIENSIKGRLLVEEGNAKLGGLQSVTEQLRKIKRMLFTACGTAFYAALVGRYMLEEYAGIPVEADIASEFRYRKPIIDEGTALLCVSQSGETADTMAALKEMKTKGVLTLGVVNAVGSSIARETDAGVYNHIGSEIGVASTKAFISQLTIMALLTLFLGRQRNLSLIKGQRIAQDLQGLSEKARIILSQESQKIKTIAEKYQKYNNFIFLGRKYNYPVALEGALKLKEVSYVHAEGYASGEMKHGPIALANEELPFIFIAPQDSVYEKVISNIQEVKARKAPVIVITNEGDEKIKELADDIIYIPKTSEMLTPILASIPLHLFAYHMGVLKGNDVDKPRNLAKSVTVE